VPRSEIVLGAYDQGQDSAGDPDEYITLAAAKELERAESTRAVTDLEFADQQKAVARARGMIRVARHRNP